MKERTTKRQRKGINPDLDELNMSDGEIRMAQGFGTSPFDRKDRLRDFSRIKGTDRGLTATEPPERPAASSDRNDPEATRL